MDHVRQYRIPREYLEEEGKEGKEGEDDRDNPEYEGMDEEEIAKRKWEKRLYKPSGPDGKGWGDFRGLNATDLSVLQEYEKYEQKEESRRVQMDALRELDQQRVEGVMRAQKPQEEMVVDEDKRWEIMFRKKLEEEEKEARRREKEEMKE